MKKVLLSLMIIPAFSFSAFAKEDSKRHEGIVAALNALDEIAEELKAELKDMIKKEGAKINIDQVIKVGEHIYDLNKSAEILHTVEHYKKNK